MGSSPLLIGFIAVVIGGMHSLPGAVLAVMSMHSSPMFSPSHCPPRFCPYRDAVMFVNVIAFLVLKPEGICAATTRRSV